MNSHSKHKFRRRTKSLIAFFTVSLFAISLSWNIYNQKQSHMAILKNIAETSLAKDKMLRFWATSHGGVYVPVDEHTPPNPYLVTANKVVDIDGRAYTLMNPAYMLRQMMERYDGLYGTKSHITGLNPINPQNEPDAWEKSALEKLAGGEKSYYSFYNEGDKRYLRYMTPYETLPRCLKCHAYEGYKVGEVRGGVSIKIPLDTFEEQEKNNIFFLVVSHLVLLGITLLFIVFIIRKIEKDNYEKMLQQEMLVKQSKLSAMGMMIENIAHQWRQPLGALSLVVENIEFSHQRGKLDDASLNKAVEKSKQLIQGMSATIDDFRNFFKPDRERTVFCVADNIDEVMMLVAASMKKYDIAIEKEMVCSCRVEGFSNEFSQVLLNIIVNAKDALRGNATEDPRIRIRVVEREGWCVTEISDNAGGMSDAILDKIFEPYFTTKEDEDGTGIGLHMSKIIIEEHMHGTITARNDAEGAVFEICVKSAPEG